MLAFRGAEQRTGPSPEFLRVLSGGTLIRMGREPVANLESPQAQRSHKLLPLGPTTMDTGGWHRLPGCHTGSYPSDGLVQVVGDICLSTLHALLGDADLMWSITLRESHPQTQKCQGFSKEPLLIRGPGAHTRTYSVPALARGCRPVSSLVILFTHLSIYLSVHPPNIEIPPLPRGCHGFTRPFVSPGAARN